jgi:hypothetical protein
MTVESVPQLSDSAISKSVSIVLKVIYGAGGIIGRELLDQPIIAIYREYQAFPISKVR